MFKKKVGLTIGMTKNAVKSMDYSKFIGLGLKLQSKCARPSFQ